MEEVISLQQVKNGGILTLTINNKPTTSSWAVARKFGYRHSYILKKIRKINQGAEFWKDNFVEHYYIDRNGQRRPQYLMTKRGFLVLCMRKKKVYDQYMLKLEIMDHLNHLEALLKLERLLQEQIDSAQKVISRSHEALACINYIACI